jgi:hypothetical protein
MAPSPARSPLPAACCSDEEKSLRSFDFDANPNTDAAVIHTPCDLRDLSPVQADPELDQASVTQGSGPVDLAGDRCPHPATARPAPGGRPARPWEKKAEPHKLTPARGRGGRNLHAKSLSPARAPKPSAPGPGRPNEEPRPAARHDLGRVLATGETYARPAHHKKGTKPRRQPDYAPAGDHTTDERSRHPAVEHHAPQGDGGDGA